jgi:Protein phosphatase 2C
MRTHLDGILASAVEEVRRLHEATCDLANPDSPSTTVSIARVDGMTLDCLILADSPIVVWHPRGVTHVFDDERIANLPGGRPYTRELVRSCRNVPGGFWVASTKPEAAYHAVRGSISLDAGAEIGIFTDGVTRLVEFYQHTWDSLFELLRKRQPQGVISSVREMEQMRQPSYGKRHDDASVAYITSISIVLYAFTRLKGLFISHCCIPGGERHSGDGQACPHRSEPPLPAIPPSGVPRRKAHAWNVPPNRHTC